MANTIDTNNSFPPLISGNSLDLNQRKQLFGSSVLTSCVFNYSTEDPFFNPTAYTTFTGYAADGSHYTNGVRDYITQNTAWSQKSVVAGSNPFVNGTLLDDGRILIIESYNSTDLKTYFQLYTTGSVNYYYDGTTKRSLNIPRGSNFKSQKLDNGDVLIIGGDSYATGYVAGDKVVGLEAFSPLTNSFYLFKSVLPQQIDKFSIIKLNDGTVLITGGYIRATTTPNTQTYVFDPVADTINTISLALYRLEPELISISDNEFVIIGGMDSNNNTNPVQSITKVSTVGYTTSSWGQLYNNGCWGQKSIVFNNKIYIFGGWDPVSNSPIAQPGTGGVNGIVQVLDIVTGGSYRFISGLQMSVPKRDMVISLLPDNKVFVLGGIISGGTETNLNDFVDLNLNTLSTDSNFNLSLASSKGSLIYYNNSIAYIGSPTTTNANFRLNIHDYFQGQIPVYASWYVENQSEYRGSNKEFPNYGLVVVTDAGFSIFDQQNKFSLWMSFVRGDLLAFTNIFDSTKIVSFTPKNVYYDFGNIVILMNTDPGTVDITAPMVLTIDFVNDRVYLDVEDNT